MLGILPLAQVFPSFVHMSSSLVCKALEEGACGRVSFVPGTASDTCRARGPVEEGHGGGAWEVGTGAGRE